MSKHGLEIIAELSPEERSELVRQTAAETGMNEASVEKDIWVCWVLNRIFSDAELSKNVLFKGGTSLSKCYDLIKRFSEDIDLILDWDLVTDGEDPHDERSNTQQDRFNKKMNAATNAYLELTFKEQIEGLVGDKCSVRLIKSIKNEPPSLELTYPKAFDSEYIKPIVLLEVSPMSAMTPNKEFTLEPYCSGLAAAFAPNTEFVIRAIEAKKSFWDKITILHVEAHRPESKDQPARYSRHYYDIYQMLNSNVVDEAMADLALLKKVVEFKNKFYPQGWANYAGALDGAYKLIPEEFRVEQLRSDYAQMEQMIYGIYPAFDDIMSKISDFETKLNGVND